MKGKKIMKYLITVSDTATYPIEADDLANAIQLAEEWFTERKPLIEIEVVEEFDDEIR